MYARCNEEGIVSEGAEWKSAKSGKKYLENSNKVIEAVAKFMRLRNRSLDWIIGENQNEFKPDFHQLYLDLDEELTLPKNHGEQASFNQVDRVGAFRFHLLEFLRANQNDLKAFEQENIQNLKKTIAELEAEKIEMSKSLHEVNDKKQKAVKALWDARDSMSKRKSEAEAFTSEALQTLQDGVLEIRNRLEESEAVVKSLQAEKMEIQAENRSLKRKLGDNDDKISQLTEQNKKLKLGNCLNANNFELERKLSKLRSEKVLLMREKQTQQTNFERFQEESQTKIRQLELSSHILKTELRESRKRSALEDQNDSLSKCTELMKKLKL